MIDKRMTDTPLMFGEGRLAIEDIVAIAEGRRSVALSDDPGFRERIDKGVAFLDSLLREDGAIDRAMTG